MVETDKFQTTERIFYKGGDEPKPETNKKYFRIYGHNLVPYVNYCKYAFSAKGIPFQEVECNLENQAKWHKDFNWGRAPILETPSGRLIKESSIIMLFA